LYEDDDVTAFVSLWLQPSMPQNANPADFNYDGIADLEDWAILNAELPEMATAVAHALAVNVPEPSTFALCCIFGTLAMLNRKRDRKTNPS
jgi:hypothetical protein